MELCDNPKFTFAGELTMDNRTTLLCAIISGAVSLGVAYITTGKTFDQKLEEISKQIPRQVRPSSDNCKPASETPQQIPGEPNVCGKDYFMTGINHEGKTVCCTGEPVR
jgi:hypothetical protein